MYIIKMLRLVVTTEELENSCVLFNQANSLKQKNAAREGDEGYMILKS